MPTADGAGGTDGTRPGAHFADGANATRAYAGGVHPGGLDGADGAGDTHELPAVQLPVQGRAGAGHRVRREPAPRLARRLAVAAGAVGAASAVVLIAGFDSRGRLPAGRGAARVAARVRRRGSRRRRRAGRRIRPGPPALHSSPGRTIPANRPARRPRRRPPGRAQLRPRPVRTARRPRPPAPRARPRRTPPSPPRPRRPAGPGRSPDAAPEAPRGPSDRPVRAVE